MGNFPGYWAWKGYWADWAAAHEPREAPTERLADLAEWVKKLATAVSSAFSALSRTGKLQLFRINTPFSG